MTHTCELAKNCPIFHANLLDKFAGEVYSKIYCTQSEKVKDCKRYQAYKKIKAPIPEYIMPNSHLSLEEIILRTESR